MIVTSKDIELAEIGRKLIRSRANRKVRVAIGSSKTVDLPEAINELLEDALTLVSEGKGAIVVPESAELTTQQVADILNVSRPYVVKMLENDEIPFRKIGRHRRVLAADVLSYKANIDKKRLSVLEKLAAEAQELGLGY